MIALIDYGAGNLTSVRKAFGALGADLFVPASPGEVGDATAIVVPGVGHFGATRRLDDEWTDAILGRVGEGRPLLGICLGMQWLFEGSDEAPECRGLGLLAGQCFRLTGSPEVKIPHVGWNAIEMRRESPIAEGVPSGAQVYFTHSFAAPITGHTIAAAEHGQTFAAIVQRGHVVGVQFHPEKSGDAGLRILSNFAHLAGF